MLSMKALRVAIVTMGSALLLGSGLAYGQADGLTELQLDSRAAANRPVQLYALETMAGGFVPAGTTTRYYGLDSIGTETDEATNQLHLAVNVKRRIADDETVFVRLELGGGLVFDEGADIDLDVREMDTAEVRDDEGSVTTPYARGQEIGGASADFGDRTSGGTPGSSFIVFPIESTDDIPIGSRISLDVTDDLAAPRAAGAYTATISAHTDPDDAIDGVGARNTLFGGSATIISLTNGLRVNVAKGGNVTSEVGLGFLWFSGPSAQERLGWVDVKPASPGGATVYNAANGEPVEDDDLIGDNGIEVIVEGELGIGAFSFIKSDAADAATGVRTASGMCPKGSADAPDRGTLMERDEDGGFLIDMEGVNSGATEGTSGPLAVLDGMMVHSLCVNVDVTGPETNASRIPETEFTGTVMITPAGAAVRPSDAYVGATGVIGKIVRNGASVEIPYLTTSEKHNQRLIVVNRGSRAAAITDITFTSEDGTDVELMGSVQAAIDAGMLAVPAKSSWVARMDETISITGDSRRVAASVAFAAQTGDISVATTQVNLEDGSTDTVLYTVD